jgi:hypothetical protein
MIWELGASAERNKQKYDELKATLIGAGVPAMPAAEDAMEFLSKLDMLRYGLMFSFLTNRAPWRRLPSDPT